MCEFRYFMVAVEVSRIFELRSTILCNLRFSSIFKRKKILGWSSILYIYGSIRWYNWKFTLNNVKCWLQIYASVLTSEIWAEIHMERIVAETKKSMFAQRQLQSHSLGGPHPHVSNTFHPRINQYHRKNWSNRKDNDKE